MSDLLPCPFCGVMPELVIGPFGEHIMQCSSPSCGAGLSGHCWQADEKQAKVAWNSRYNQRPTDGLLACMALRLHHDFGIMSRDEQQTVLAYMRQIHEEVVGKGFYKPEYEENYLRAIKDE